VLRKLVFIISANKLKFLPFFSSQTATAAANVAKERIIIVTCLQSNNNP